MRTKQVLVAFMILIVQAIMLSSCMRPPFESEFAAQIGSAAPKFKLPDLSGQMVSLDQYKGKIVMLDFWQISCGPCRTTMPLLENLQKEYPKTLVLLAVNVQEPADTVRDYVQEQSIHSRVLLDVEGITAQAYGVGGIPMQVLIDKSGIIRHIQVGYHQSMLSQLRAQIIALK